MNNDKNSKHIKTQSQSYNSNFISNNYYPVCPNFNKKELWNYIFRLQNYLLEEIEFHDRQKQSFFLEIEQKNILLKQLMKEKADYDSYKGYSSLGNYMDIMEPYEILEIMKGAKELKSSFNMKKRMEESQKANNEKLEKIMIEMNNLEEENNFLKSELDTTRNESFIFKQLILF